VASSCWAARGLECRTTASEPKAAATVLAIRRSLTKQGAFRGRRPAASHPGSIATPTTERRRADPGHHQLVGSRVPLGQYGEPDEVAHGVLYLAWDESAFVTGRELAIDGGWTARQSDRRPGPAPRAVVAGSRVRSIGDFFLDETEPGAHP
jgi:NAD(P)-dependent dehydrogenase (short-subunit alcohol dehydrogenase family)